VQIRFRAYKAANPSLRLASHSNEMYCVIAT
jgi:hypothetical protein